MPMPAASASAADRMRTGLPFDRDGAGIGLVDAEQDVHQRGLAGAVLAEQAEDLAGAEHEVDVVIGAHAAKALRDAAHFDERRRVDMRASARSWRLRIGRTLADADLPSPE